MGGIKGGINSGDGPARVDDGRSEGAQPQPNHVAPGPARDGGADATVLACPRYGDSDTPTRIRRFGYGDSDTATRMASGQRSGASAGHGGARAADRRADAADRAFTSPLSRAADRRRAEPRSRATPSEARRGTGPQTAALTQIPAHPPLRRTHATLALT